MNRHFKTLELDKILKLLANETTIPEAQEEALKIEPAWGLFEVEELLKQTEDAHMLIGRFGAPSFGGASNITNALRRAQAGGCLTTIELLRIAQGLRVIRGIKEWRNKSASIETSLDNHFESLTTNKFLEDKINTCIIGEEELSDNASPTLYDIRRKIRIAQSKAREVLDKIIHSSTYQKYLQDAIVTQRDGRYVVPVKSECRGNVAGLVHDTSASGSTVFIEPMGVVQANNDIRVLESKEKAEIERILYELSASCGTHADEIIESYKFTVELNIIFAKAQLAYKMKAVKPKMNDKGIIDLKQARHPLIPDKNVVPTDITLGKEFDTLVITGPNTGGKTVSLKT
ncbi:MAG: endonuclease MutS2, partial [Eubacteriales bacterium]|nr:endonuclease MutS2 [Eubacteriales bacterium]